MRSLKTLEARIDALEAKLATKTPIHTIFCAQDPESVPPVRKIWVRGCAALIGYRDAADITPDALASILGDAVNGPIMKVPAPAESIDAWEREAMQQQSELMASIKKEREIST